MRILVLKGAKIARRSVNKLGRTLFVKYKHAKTNDIGVMMSPKRLNFISLVFTR